MPFLRVAVPLPVHGAFTYTHPTPLPIGTAVVVPFGARKVNGWIVGTGAEGDHTTIKGILEVRLALS